jgi:hypothetical protein
MDVVIISVWCLFSKLKPCWISKYIILSPPPHIPFRWKVNHRQIPTARRRWPWPLNTRFIYGQPMVDVHYTQSDHCNVTVIMTIIQAVQTRNRRCCSHHHSRTGHEGNGDNHDYSRTSYHRGGVEEPYSWFWTDRDGSKYHYRMFTIEAEIQLRWVLTTWLWKVDQTVS